MKLPKMYRVVTVGFWGLRGHISASGGFEFDCDEMVYRKARRVATDDGWKWQLVFKDWEFEWDHCIDSDEICFDNCENSDISWV